LSEGRIGPGWSHRDRWNEDSGQRQPAGTARYNHLTASKKQIKQKVQEMLEEAERVDQEKMPGTP